MSYAANGDLGSLNSHAVDVGHERQASKLNGLQICGYVGLNPMRRAVQYRTSRQAIAEIRRAARSAIDLSERRAHRGAIS